MHFPHFSSRVTLHYASNFTSRFKKLSRACGFEKDHSLFRLPLLLRRIMLFTNNARPGATAIGEDLSKCYARNPWG
jgi:hypothetical protein